LSTRSKKKKTEMCQGTAWTVRNYFPDICTGRFGRQV